MQETSKKIEENKEKKKEKQLRIRRMIEEIEERKKLYADSFDEK